MKDLCFKEADILLPPPTADMSKWSVIACDQYTSDSKYWQSIREFVGNDISALNMIFPEIYLETESESEKSVRVKSINETMMKYAKILRCYKDSVFYIERTLRNGSIRRGFVGAVDLEEYDYKNNSRAKIRATEKTVIDRLPPRVKIRRTAVLEIPHVMLLYNETGGEIVQGIRNNINGLEKVYDFTLMEGSGSVKAYKLDEKNKAALKAGLCALEKNSPSNLLFAVGDGNHSLAAAKECYEEIKKQLGSECLNHPARHALVEIVNIYDESLNFEPIYRVLFGVDPENVIESMKKEFDISIGAPSIVSREPGENKNYHKFEVYYGDKSVDIFVNNPKYYLPVKVLQEFLDGYLELEGARIDYIHGMEETVELSRRRGNIGFVFDTMKKGDLFETIERDGVLPRKTFSMGEAYDKRFYIECRRIFGGCGTKL